MQRLIGNHQKKVGLQHPDRAKHTFRGAAATHQSLGCHIITQLLILYLMRVCVGMCAGAAKF